MGYHKKKRYQQQANNKLDTQKQPIIPPIPVIIKETEKRLSPNFTKSNLSNSSKSNIQIIITDESDDVARRDSLTKRVEAVRTLPSVSTSLGNHVHAKSKLMERSFAADEQYDDDYNEEKMSKTSNENTTQTNDEGVSVENDLKSKSKTKITDDRPTKRPVLNKTVSVVSPHDSFEDSYVSSSLSSFTSSESTLKVKSDTNSSEPDLYQNTTTFFVPDDSFRFKSLQKSFRYPMQEPNELKNKFYKLKKEPTMMPKQTILKINSIDTSDLNRHLTKHCSCHPHNLHNTNTPSKQLRIDESSFTLANSYTNEYNTPMSLRAQRQHATLNLKKMSSHPNSQSISIVNEHDLVNSSRQMTAYNRSKSDHNFCVQNYPYFVRLPIYKIKDNILIKDAQQPYNNNNNNNNSTTSTRQIRFFPTNSSTEYKTKHPNSKAMLNAANEAALATETYLSRKCNHQSNLLARETNCRTLPELFWPRETVNSPPIQMVLMPSQKNPTQVNKNHRVYRIRKRIPLLKQSSYNAAYKQTDIHAQDSNNSTANDFSYHHHHHDGNNSKNSKRINDAQFYKLKRTTSV